MSCSLSNYRYIKRPFIIDYWRELIRKKKLPGRKQLDPTGQPNNHNSDVEQSITNQHNLPGQTDISKFEVSQSAFNQHGGDEDQVVNHSKDNQIAFVKSIRHLCTYCNKVFRTKNVLTKHMEIHESESNHDSSSCIKTSIGTHSVSSSETFLCNTVDAPHSDDDIADEGTKSNEPSLTYTSSDDLIGDISKTSVARSTVTSDATDYSCLDAKIPHPVARRLPVVLSDTSGSDDDRPTVISDPFSSDKELTASASKTSGIKSQANSPSRSAVLLSDSSSSDTDLATKTSQTSRTKSQAKGPLSRCAVFGDSSSSDNELIAKTSKTSSGTRPQAKALSRRYAVLSSDSSGSDYKLIGKASKTSSGKRKRLQAKCSSKRHAVLSDSSGSDAKLVNVSKTSLLKQSQAKVLSRKPKVFSDLSNSGDDFIVNASKTPRRTTSQALSPSDKHNVLSSDSSGFDDELITKASRAQSRTKTDAKSPSSRRAIFGDLSGSDKELKAKDEDLTVKLTKTSSGTRSQANALIAQADEENVQAPAIRSPVFGTSLYSDVDSKSKVRSILSTPVCDEFETYSEQQRPAEVTKTKSNSRDVGLLKKYQCGYCDDTFLDGTSLRNHIKVHSNKVMVKNNVSPGNTTQCFYSEVNSKSCVYCGDKFENLASLKVHIDMHMQLLKKTDDSVNVNRVECTDDDVVFVSERKLKDQDVNFVKETGVRHTNKVKDSDASLSSKGQGLTPNKSCGVQNRNQYNTSRNSNHMAEMSMKGSISSKQSTSLIKEHSETEHILTAADLSVIEDACKELHPVTPEKHEPSLKEISVKVQKSRINKTTPAKGKASSKLCEKSSPFRHSKQKDNKVFGSSESTPKYEKETICSSSLSSSSSTSVLAPAPKCVKVLRLSASARKHEKVYSSSKSAPAPKCVKVRRLSAASAPKHENVCNLSTSAPAPKCVKVRRLSALALTPKKLHPINAPLPKSPDMDSQGSFKEEELSSSAPKQGFISTPKKLHPTETLSSKPSNNKFYNLLKGKESSSWHTSTAKKLRPVDVIPSKHSDKECHGILKGKVPKQQLILTPKNLHPALPQQPLDEDFCSTLKGKGSSFRNSKAEISKIMPSEKPKTQSSKISPNKGDKVMGNKQRKMLDPASKIQTMNKTHYAEDDRDVTSLLSPRTSCEDDLTSLTAETAEGSIEVPDSNKKKMQAGSMACKYMESSVDSSKEKQFEDSKLNTVEDFKHIPTKVNIMINQVTEHVGRVQMDSADNLFSKPQGVLEKSPKSKDMEHASKALGESAAKTQQIHKLAEIGNLDVKRMKAPKKPKEGTDQMLGTKPLKMLKKLDSQNKKRLLWTPKMKQRMNLLLQKSAGKKILKSDETNAVSPEANNKAWKSSVSRDDDLMLQDREQISECLNPDKFIKEIENELTPDKSSKPVLEPQDAEGAKQTFSVTSDHCKANKAQLMSNSADMKSEFTEGGDRTISDVNKLHGDKDGSTETVMKNLPSGTRKARKKRKADVRLEKRLEKMMSIEKLFEPDLASKTSSITSMQKVPSMWKHSRQGRVSKDIKQPCDESQSIPLMEIKHNDVEIGLTEYSLKDFGQEDFAKDLQELKDVPVMEGRKEINDSDVEVDITEYSPNNCEQEEVPEDLEKFNDSPVMEGGKDLSDSDVDKDVHKNSSNDSEEEAVPEDLEEPSDSPGMEGMKDLSNSDVDKDFPENSPNDFEQEEVPEDLDESNDSPEMEGMKDLSDSDIEVDFAGYSSSPLLVIDEIIECSRCNKEFSNRDSYHIHKRECFEKNKCNQDAVLEKTSCDNHEISKKHLKRKLSDDSENCSSASKKITEKPDKVSKRSKMQKRHDSNKHNMMKINTTIKVNLKGTLKFEQTQENIGQSISVTDNVERNTETPKKLQKRSITDNCENESPSKMRKSTGKPAKIFESDEYHQENLEFTKHGGSCQEKCNPAECICLQEKETDVNQSSVRKVARKRKKCDAKLQRQLEHILSIKSLFKPDSQGAIKKSKNLNLNVKKIDGGREMQQDVTKIHLMSTIEESHEGMEGCNSQEPQEDVTLESFKDMESSNSQESQNVVTIKASHEPQEDVTEESFKDLESSNSQEPQEDITEESFKDMESSNSQEPQNAVTEASHEPQEDVTEESFKDLESYSSHEPQEDVTKEFYENMKSPYSQEPQEDVIESLTPHVISCRDAENENETKVKRTTKVKKCRKCYEKFKTRCAYEDHKLTCAGISQEQTSDVSTKELKQRKTQLDSKNNCKCEVCKTAFKDEKSLKDHERSCLGKEEKKPSMNNERKSAWHETEDNKEQVNETESTTKFDTNKVKNQCSCKKCAHCYSAGDSNNDDMDDDLPHEKKDKRDRRGKFICPIADCNQILRYASGLRVHLETHKSVRELYTCTVCEKSYLYERNLNDHKLIHTGHRFKCGECGTGFTNRQSLAIHLEKGHEDVGVDQFQCDYAGCGQVFRERGHLKIHQFHIHIKKYKCEKCYVTFPSQDELDEHVKSKECEMLPHKCKLKNCACGDQKNKSVACKVGVGKDGAKEKLKKESGKVKPGKTTGKKEEKDARKDSLEKDAIRETLGHTLGKETGKMLQTETGKYEISKEKMGKDKLGKHTEKQKIGGVPKTTKLRKDVGKKNLEKEPRKEKLIPKLDVTKSSKNKTDLFICLICKKAFINQTYLDQHQKKKCRQKQVYKCHVCCQKFRHRSNWKDHMLIHAGHKFVCGECGKEFTSRTGLSNHQKAGHEPPPPPDTSKPHFGEVDIKCKYPDCGKKFKSRIDLTHHKIKTHKKGKIYKCEECSQTFVSEKSLVAHRDLHDDKNRPHKCDTCGLRFQHQATLHSHKYRFHRRASGMQKDIKMYSVPAEFHTKIKVVTRKDGTVKYRCKLCKKAYPTLRQFTVHAQVDHMGKEIFRCRFCLKKFPSRSSCTIHEAVHEGVKKFKCQYCSKPFRTKGHLKEHEVIHTSEKNHACHLCDYKCTTSAALRLHLRTHTKEKPYKCSYPDCNKAFAGLSNCKRHEKTHTDIKPHKCDTCAKAFRTVGELRKHMESHSDQKNYACKLCDKKFKASSSLHCHLRTHTGIKPHKCSYCEKGFFTAALLRIHITSHTGERPFKCRHCSKCFPRRSGRDQHEKAIHLGIKRIYGKKND